MIRRIGRKSAKHERKAGVTSQGIDMSNDKNFLEEAIATIEEKENEKTNEKTAEKIEGAEVDTKEDIGATTPNSKAFFYEDDSVIEEETEFSDEPVKGATEEAQAKESFTEKTEEIIENDNDSEEVVSEEDTPVEEEEVSEKSDTANAEHSDYDKHLTDLEEQANSLANRLKEVTSDEKKNASGDAELPLDIQPEDDSKQPIEEESTVSEPEESSNEEEGALREVPEAEQLIIGDDEDLTIIGNADMSDTEEIDVSEIRKADRVEEIPRDKKNVSRKKVIPAPEDDEEDDYNDEDDYDYLDNEGRKFSVLTTLVIVVLIFAAVTGVSFLAYNLFMDRYGDLIPSASTVETIAPTATPTATPEALSNFWEEQVRTATKNKLKELYDASEYVVPSREDMVISGDMDEAIVAFTLAFPDGSTKDAVMTAKLAENPSSCTITSVNIGGLSEEQLLATKGTNATASPNPSDSAEPVVNEPTLTRTYTVDVYSSLEVTLETSADGVAYVEAVSGDGSIVEVARQEYPGGSVTTTTLEPGTYTLNLYTTSGCGYSWSFRSN